MTGNNKRKKALAKEGIFNFPDRIFTNQEGLLNAFPNQTLTLEIGMGKGSFITNMATKFPEKTFLGIEVKEERTLNGYYYQQEQKLENLYFFCGNFFNEDFDFTKLSAKEIWFNFPDPWPKKRHHKRRLVNPKSLSTLAQILDKDGIIYFKTDSVPLHLDTVEYFEESEQFKIIQTERNLAQSTFPIKFITEFEDKYNKQGIPTTLIVAQKI